MSMNGYDIEDAVILNQTAQRAWTFASTTVAEGPAAALRRRARVKDVPVL